MSGQPPAITPKQFLRVLERQGWRIHRVTGSHHIMVHDEHRRIVVLPMHNRDLKTGTLNSLLRTAGISRDELTKLL